MNRVKGAIHFDTTNISTGKVLSDETCYNIINFTISFSVFFYSLSVSQVFYVLIKKSVKESEYV